MKDITKKTKEADIDSARAIKTAKENRISPYLIVCLLITICSVGFGLYEFYEAKNAKTREQKRENLIVEIKNKDGTISVLDDSKIEISADSRSIIIKDVIGEESTNIYKNPIIVNPNDEVKFTQGFSSSYYLGGQGDGPYQEAIHIYIVNGEIDLCEVHKVESTNGGVSFTKIKDCKIGGLSGKVSKISEVGEGQANMGDLIAFFMEDGSVEFIPFYESIESGNFNSRGKLKFDKPVSGSITISATHVEGGGYGTTVFTHPDGTYTKYDRSLLAEE